MSDYRPGRGRRRRASGASGGGPPGSVVTSGHRRVPDRGESDTGERAGGTGATRRRDRAARVLDAAEGRGWSVKMTADDEHEHDDEHDDEPTTTTSGDERPRARVTTHLLTVAETLRILNVSRATLYRRIGETGEWGDVLRPLKIGRSVRFSSSDVDDLLRVLRREGMR
jgi:predicted DNA-binding transcriptional regulator AlpA